MPYDIDLHLFFTGEELRNTSRLDKLRKRLRREVDAAIEVGIAAARAKEREAAARFVAIEIPYPRARSIAEVRAQSGPLLADHGDCLTGRNRAIMQCIVDGVSLRETARRHTMSHARVQQIIAVSQRRMELAATVAAEQRMRHREPVETK